MYVLVDTPSGGLRAEAFDSLDKAFGTEEFSQGQALAVIENSLEQSGGALFKSLVDGGYVLEVE